MVLAVDGRILYSSPMSFPLIQVDSEKLVGHYMPTYMKVDDIPVFLEDFKDNMATGRPWRYHHRLRRQDGTFAIFESTFKPYTENLVFEQAGLKPTKMCLMTSRPYPIPSTSLMDSFLEHCTTHIRLTAQLAKLKEESQTISQSTTTTAVAYNQNDDTIQCATLTVETSTVSCIPNIDTSVRAWQESEIWIVVLSSASLSTPLSLEETDNVCSPLEPCLSPTIKRLLCLSQVRSLLAKEPFQMRQLRRNRRWTL